MPTAAGPQDVVEAELQRFGSALKEFTDAKGTISIEELKGVLMRPAEGGNAMSDEDSDICISHMLEEGIDVLAGYRVNASECAQLFEKATRGPSPLTRLMMAISDGIERNVHEALEAGADPNGVDEVELKWTAEAASATALPLLRIGHSQGEAAAATSATRLLDASPTTCKRTTHDTMTPALWCVQLGRTSLLAVLQMAGANLDMTVGRAAKGGCEPARTPLYQAASQGHLPMVQELLRLG